MCGVGAGELAKPSTKPDQLELFGGKAESAKIENLDQTVDRIREKFGDAALRRGSQLLDNLE
jgi:hypothetical protein